MEKNKKYDWCIILAGLLLLTISTLMLSCTKDIVEPTIRYGEFSTTLVYEINGKQHVDEDVWVCEYEGISYNTGSGKKRMWTSKLKSGKDHFVLYRDEVCEIYIGVDNQRGAEILMSDPQARKYIDYDDYLFEVTYPFPNAFIETKDGNLTSVSIIEATELYQKYGIRLIDFTCAQPIENTFE